MIPKAACLTLCLLLAAGIASGQSPSSAAVRDQVRAYRVAHEREILRRFRDLLAVPNIASDTPNINRNADLIVGWMRQRGIETQLLRVENAPPVVYGQWRTPGAKRTLTFYAHYDGQPVNPAEWKGAPFTPVLRDAPLEAGGHDLDWNSLPEHLNPEWRLYARSASDDKTPIAAMLTALEALSEARMQPAANFNFFFEGEEEAGSPHLGAYLTKYADLLRTDAWILCDGPVHPSRRQQLFFGARGVTALDLTVYGPIHGVHSGHYGNWAPNPIMELTHLLDRMRDNNAHILIPGFYDDVRPLTAAEQDALAAAPEVETGLKQELALAATEGDGASLAAQILKPALNVHGIESGHVGASATNLIQTEATASIDFRLVPEQTPEKVRERVEAFLRQEGYFLTTTTPDKETRRSHPRIVKLTWGDGYPAARTPLDSPLAKQIVRVMEQTQGAPPIRMPTVGGSVPMYLFQEGGTVPVLLLPIANHDNNQHTFNENLRLQNLWDGMELFAGLFTQMGKTE